MRRAAVLLNRCLVAVAILSCATLEGSQSPQPGSGASQDRRIDGSKTPELIPDEAALQILFFQLTGPGSARMRERFVAECGLSEDDSKLVFIHVDRYEEARAEADRASRVVRREPGQPLPQAQREAVMQAHLQADRVLADALRSFEFDLSPAGRAQLQAYVLSRIKKNMSIVDSGFNPAVAAESGGSVAVAVRPSGARRPANPYAPDHFGGAGDEAGMRTLVEAAASALSVVHIAEGEMHDEVELWNASTKTIDTFRVAICAPLLSSVSGMGSLGLKEMQVGPGDKTKMLVSKRSSPRCDPMTPKTIAVIFEDGTAVGLPAQIRDIKLEHLGRMIQAEIALRILEAAGDSPNLVSLLESVGDTPSGDIETVHAAYLSSLPPETASDARLSSFEARRALVRGMSQMRHSLRARIEQLNGPPGPAPPGGISGWERLRQEYRDQVRRAVEYRERVGLNLYPSGSRGR